MNQLIHSKNLNYIATITVSFKFTVDYPDSEPEIVIEESENLRDEDEFLEFLKEIVIKI